MHPSAAPGTRAAFAQLALEGANAARIADMTVAQWHNVQAVLSPIIGQPGVAALFKRSLYLTRTEHPCLATLYVGALQPDEFAALRGALAQETDFNAAAASDALCQTFQDLLTNLIGASLTERLLQTAWNPPSSGDAVRDISP